VNVLHCTFKDILSQNNGGAFNIHGIYKLLGEDLSFNNVTSLGLVKFYSIPYFFIILIYYNNSKF